MKIHYFYDKTANPAISVCLFVCLLFYEYLSFLDDETDRILMTTKLVDKVLPPGRGERGRGNNNNKINHTHSHQDHTHLLALITTRSPALPTSTDPLREATPSEAAALMVAAASASGMLMWNSTHAKCIVIG